MILRQLGIILLALLIGGPVFAQTPSFQGKVIDADSGESLDALNVILLASGDTLVTDALGEFFIEFPPKNDTLIITGGAYHLEFPFTFPTSCEGVCQDQFYLHQQISAITAIPVASIVRYEDAGILEPVAATSVPPLNLVSNDQSSLQQALNDIPGVRFESRGNGGSRRLNIRGSMLRSPFAVRNVKIYWDEFPLTSPDGQSALELLDPLNIGSLLVVKGSTSSAYGAGTGGVLLAKSDNIRNSGNYIQSGVTIGTYNYLRTATELNSSGGGVAIRFSHVFQETDGYREQEFNWKQQFDLKLHYDYSNELTYFLWATQYNGRWGLPGAITAREVALAPHRVWGDAVTLGARVERGRQRIGVAQRLTKRRFTNTTAVYLNRTSKVNPYGTSAFYNGYKDEHASGGGIRNVTLFRIIDKIDDRKLELHARLTAEYTREENELLEFDNDNGSPGRLRYENTALSQEFTVGATGLLTCRKLNAQFGLVFSDRSVDAVNILHSVEDSILRSPVERHFNSPLPFFRASVNYHKKHAIYAGISQGISPPSLFELLSPNTGIISTDLQAENALHMDAGIRGLLKRLHYDFGAYQSTIENGIRQYEDSAGAYFINRGGQVLQGLEGRVSFSKRMRRLHVVYGLSISGALQSFRFQGDEEIDGNFIPGNHVSMSSTNLWLDIPYGFRVSANWQWNDKMYANDENTVSLLPYEIVNLHISWKSNFQAKVLPWEIEINAGIQNVFDTTYTSFLAVNAFGYKYHNPMPLRNYYAGFNLRRNF